MCRNTHPVQHRNDRRTCGSDRGDTTKNQPFAQSSEQGLSATVANVGYRNEFAAGHVHKARDSVHPACRRRYQTAISGPDGVYYIERRRAVHFRNGEHRSQMRVPESDVVNVRPSEYPLACLRLLIQGEHMNLVVKRQPSDQSQQRRDHAVFPRTVDASRYHQSNAHLPFSLVLGLSRPASKQFPQCLHRLQRMAPPAQLESFEF